VITAFRKEGHPGEGYNDVEPSRNTNRLRNDVAPHDRREIVVVEVCRKEYGGL
jgi:hypothetical protein